MLCNPLPTDTMTQVVRLLIDEFSFARLFPRSRQKTDPFPRCEESED
jgi:hypothetical protein